MKISENFVETDECMEYIETGDGIGKANRERWNGRSCYPGTGSEGTAGGGITMKRWYASGKSSESPVNATTKAWWSPGSEIRTALTFVSTVGCFLVGVWGITSSVVSGVEARMDRIETTMAEGFRESNARMDRIEAAMAEGFRQSNARMDRIESDLNRIESDIKRIEADIDRMETRMGHIETDIDRIESRMDRMAADIDDIENRMDRIESDVAGIESRMDRMETRMDRIETDIDRIENRLAAAAPGQTEESGRTQVAGATVAY